MTMTDNHPTPEEREELAKIIFDLIPARHGSSSEAQSDFDEAYVTVDRIIAAGWRPQTPESPKPEVGVEDNWPAGYTERSFADLATELGRLNAEDDDFPNYASWAVELPAGHWRAILERLETAPPAVEGWRPTHRHVKRGSEYQLSGHAILQAGPHLADMSLMAIYRDAEGQNWVRPWSEFNDGRFEPLPAPPASSPTEPEEKG